MDKHLDAADTLLKALADPTRLRIVGLLRQGEVCVCHLHESLGISQPKASRHLAYLRGAGVVVGEKRGLWVHYRLAEQPNPAVQALLDAASHCVTHATTAQRDTKRLVQKTGCCVVEERSVDHSCCTPAPRTRR